MRTFQIVLRNDLSGIIGLSDFITCGPNVVTAEILGWLRKEHITLAIGDTLSIEEVMKE